LEDFINPIKLGIKGGYHTFVYSSNIILLVTECRMHLCVGHLLDQNGCKCNLVYNLCDMPYCHHFLCDMPDYCWPYFQAFPPNHTESQIKFKFCSLLSNFAPKLPNFSSLMSAQDAVLITKKLNSSVSGI
jgi:hypothetical protein